MFGEPDVIETPDTLAFAGIPPASVRVYPLETHIAEKLHAYTIPRPRPNTRVKDLPDIALLAGVREIEPANLRAALDRILEDRLRRLVRAEATVTGVDLAKHVFDDKKLAVSTVAAEQEAVHLLFRGVFGFIHNSVHHRLVHRM